MKSSGLKGVIIVVVFFLVETLFGLVTTFDSVYADSKADTLYKKGRYSESLKLYSKMEEKNSNKLEHTYNKGVSEYKLNQFDKASESFAKVASNTKNKDLKIKSLFNLGNSEASAKNFDGAISAYEEALGLDPENERIKQNLEYVKNLKEQQKNQKDSKDNKGNKDNKNNKDQNNKDNQKNQNNQNDQNDQNNQNNQNDQNQANKEDKDQNQNQNQDKNSLGSKDKDKDKNQNKDKSGSLDQKEGNNNQGSYEDSSDYEKELKKKQAEVILNKVEDKASEYMNKLNSQERKRLQSKPVEKDW